MLRRGPTRASRLPQARDIASTNPGSRVTQTRMPPLPQRIDLLEVYKAKRNFARTPEPQSQPQAGKEVAAPGAGPALFVVQKHWASSLHYDFRLQLDGTLKSWAVPKGPSLDPKIKRMAVQVEDHPIAYAAFEGSIPAGQYGAGKVVIWDAGTWTPLGDPLQAYRDGNLKFVLQGHKLQGKWVLVRMKGQGDKQNAWLLIKETDAWARASADFSVVDEQPDSVQPLGLLHAGVAAQPAPADMAPPGVAAELPEALSPQLASLATRLPASPEDWLYEIKFDGYRMLVRVEHGKARFLTRNGHDWTTRLSRLRKTIEALKWPPGWYDGEIVVPDDQGIPDFDALQQAFDAGSTGEIVLYLFDLPYFDGQDLRSQALEQRRALLKSLLASAPQDLVRFSDDFDAAPDGIVDSACRLGLEGIIAKRRSSRYQSSRSQDWIKLKCGLRQEFVIGGYTDPQGTREGFGSLLLGVHDAKGALQYAGNVGSGFSQSGLRALKTTLAAQAQTASPFSGHPKIEGKPHWIDPTLVAEVSFAAWTRTARIRHAVFRGLRTDKDASTIVREKALRVKSLLSKPDGSKPESPKPERSNPAMATSSPSLPGSRKTTKQAHITNAQRVIDASTGTTKLDLVRYYGVVGNLMMKHLKGRPVSLVRAPEGVAGQQFFQKHAETDKLPGMRELGPASSGGRAAMLEIVNAQGLLAAAQWNVIEFHTMNAGAASLEHPDRMVFDLDPGEGVAWAQMQEAAQLMHIFLTQLGLPSFLKTSGGKGLHVVVPVRRVHDWGTVKGFSQAIVRHMAQTIPQRFVAKSGPGNRVGKIFIDFLRNGQGATTVCAWSARARPGLGISVPVAWNELQSLHGGNHWTVKTVHKRLDVGNEPWKNYAKAARSLTAAMATMEYKLPSESS